MIGLANISKRQKQIILLLLEKNDYVTGSAIAESTGISRKTVEREVQSLNTLFGSPCLIESKKGYGYRLNSDRRQEVREELLYKNKQQLVIPQVQRERIEWILTYIARETFENKVFRFEDMADDLFVSLTTLKKDLNPVRDELKKYGISIKKKGKQGSVLSGEEKDIRRFLNDYLARDLDSGDLYKIYYGDIEDYKHLCDLVLEILEEYQVNITDLGFRNLVLNLLVAARRMDQNSLDISERTNEIDTHSQEYKAACAIRDRVLKPHTSSENIPDAELNSIYYYLISRPKQVGKGNKQDFQIKGKRHQDIEECILMTFDDVRKFYNLDIRNENLLENQLILHIDAALDRVEYGMTVKNDMLDEIKQNYPFEMQVSLLLTAKLNERFHIQLDEAEIGFLAMYFAAMLENTVPSENTRKIRVLIVSTTYTAAALLLKSKLENRLKDQIEVCDICSSMQWEKDEQDTDIDPDFILTDIEDLDGKGVPVIHYSPVVSDSEVEDICSRLCNEQPVSICSLLNENLFIYIQEKLDKDQVLGRLTDLIREYGLANEECINSIYQREKMASTEVGNLAAIPHNIAGDVFQPSILIAVLQNPITWDEGEVQLVVLMLTDKQKEKYKKLLGELYEKINTPEKVRKIVNQHSFSYFKNLFNDSER